ncbi:SWIM zinc finger family protein [Haloarcula onubensis]|uniref:SWIM zinc finger family protein n=1 Tax=Haloarcula onubensis TaxID=2950539 RepID=A0ABU2FNH7_9EURY|nr:SWIM zinc finger family protein [Halomicroarcula sp. S3CR25-11]MDS0281846.1 SWIM zinc finger family protein [Halomicroarcula sp. S3CR25-11]
MTLITPSDDTEPTALAPDPDRLDARSRRAWTERMLVDRRPDDTYAVTTESGHTYRVDLRTHDCSCPDHRIRGEQCKHLRRVAIEITARRVAPPGRERARCDLCGSVTFVGRDASPPHRCRHCELVPGDVVLDRETGDRLVVARVTDERADEWVIRATGETVAEYERNDGYPTDDPVVEATYLSARRRSSPRRYAFPRSRLERTDEQLVE